MCTICRHVYARRTHCAVCCVCNSIRQTRTSACIVCCAVLSCTDATAGYTNCQLDEHRSCRIYWTFCKCAIIIGSMPWFQFVVETNIFGPLVAKLPSRKSDIRGSDTKMKNRERYDRKAANMRDRESRRHSMRVNNRRENGIEKPKEKKTKKKTPKPSRWKR